MSKIINAIIVGLFGAICFSVGIYYATLELEEQVNVWDSNYQIITDKVYAFEKVSDPKTIRLYVKELNKILDEIHFLSKIVKSGQLADESLTSILDEQQDINKRLGDIITKYDQYIVKANNRDESLGYHVDELWEWTFLKEETDSTRSKSLVDKLNLIQANLDNIEGLIKEIQDSKINKFW